MVIDTSAVVAILQKETDWEALLEAMNADPVRLISAVTALEAALVLEGRYGVDAGADLDLFLYSAGVERRAFDSTQTEIGRRAWRQYGKGNHPAGLNFGDCCSYALAKITGEPLLCKGRDFSQTNLRLVVIDRE